MRFPKNQGVVTTDFCGQCRVFKFMEITGHLQADGISGSDRRKFIGRKFGIALGEIYGYRKIKE